MTVKIKAIWVKVIVGTQHEKVTVTLRKNVVLLTGKHCRRGRRGAGKNGSSPLRGTAVRMYYAHIVVNTRCSC